jgi:hypothetical protein
VTSGASRIGRWARTWETAQGERRKEKEMGNEEIAAKTKERHKEVVT